MIPKFRAWDKKEKSMWHVRTLLLNQQVAWLVEFGEEGENEQAYPCSFENCHLMQSTGLKDKNGVEIFEGDILGRQFYINAIVSYDDGAFEQGWNCYRKHRLNQDFCSSREVIGNIYENKDLIEMG